MQVSQLPLTQIVDYNTSSKFFIEKPIEDRMKRGTDAVGRWTKEEHDRFLEGINLYGKEWKKIASLIRTRTVVQVRTHAQKYFQKVTKTATVVPKLPSVQQPMKRNADGSVKRGNTQLNIPTSCSQNANMTNTRMIHQQPTSNCVRQNQNQNQLRIKKSAINTPQPTTPLVIMQQIPVGPQQQHFQQCQPLFNQSYQQIQQQQQQSNCTLSSSSTTSAAAATTTTPAGNSPVSVTNLEFFNSNNPFKELDEYESTDLNSSLNDLNEPVFTIPPSYINDSQDYYSLSEDFSFTTKRIRTNSILGDENENEEEFEKLFDYYNNNSNSSTTTTVTSDSI